MNVSVHQRCSACGQTGHSRAAHYDPYLAMRVAIEAHHRGDGIAKQHWLQLSFVLSMNQRFGVEAK